MDSVVEYHWSVYGLSIGVCECRSQTKPDGIRLPDPPDRKTIGRLRVDYPTQTSSVSEPSDHLGQTISDAIRHLVVLLMFPSANRSSCTELQLAYHLHTIKMTFGHPHLIQRGL